MKKCIVAVLLQALALALLQACIPTSPPTGRVMPQERSRSAPRPYGSQPSRTAFPAAPQRDIEFVVQVMKADQPVCFSPDGRFVVTIGTSRHELQLWQVSTGRLVRTFAPDPGMIEDVLYDPQGHYLMVINLNHDVRLVVVETGRTMGLLDAARSGARVVSAGFTRDGRHALIKRAPDALGAVVTAEDVFKPEQNSPRLFSLSDGAEVNNYMIADITENARCVLTADGRRFLAEVGHSQFNRPFRLEWFDVQSGQSLGWVPLKGKYRYGGPRLVLSPDARYLVSALQDNAQGKPDSYLQVVDLVTGEIRGIPVTNHPEYIQFSPDSRLLFFQPIGDSIHMIEIATGRLAHKFENGGTLARFAVAPTGALIARSKAFNAFVLEDYGQMQAVRTVGGIHAVDVADGIVFLSGDRAHSAMSRGSQLNLATGERDAFDTPGFLPLQFSGDGRRALGMAVEPDKRVNQVPDLSLRRWPEGTLITPLGRLGGYVAALSHDGRVALLGSPGSLVPAFMDVEKGGGPVAIKDYPDPGQWRQEADIAISPDGRRAAGAFTDASGQNNNDGHVHLWDTASGRRVARFEYQRRLFSFDSFGFDRLAFGPDSRYLAVALTERVNHYEGKTGTWLFGYDYWRHLERHRIEIWDVVRGGRIRVLTDLGASVTALAFSPDGAFLYSGATDGGVARWELATGRLDRTYFTPSTVSAIGISPDGRHMLVQGFALSYWEVDTGQHLYSHVEVPDAADPLGGGYLTWTTAGYYRGSDTLARGYCHLVHGMRTYALDQFFEQFYSPAMIEARVKGLEVDAVDITRVLAESPPPTVRFSTPVIDGNGRATVVVSARDTGGGVAQIRLYHNGKRIGDDSVEPVKQVALAPDGKGLRDRGLTVMPAAPAGTDATRQAPPLARGDRQRTFEVQLMSGENRLRASAFSGRMIESEPDTVSLTFAGGGTHLPYLHVVAVGIHHYRDPLAKLPMAQRDAESIVQKLTQRAPAMFGNYRVSVLYDADATREAIFGALEAVAQTAKPEDMVVVFFAGHGTVSDQDGRFHLVAHGVRDLTAAAGPASVAEAGVSDLTLGVALQKIPALKQVVFMDACQSGGADFAGAFHDAGRETAIKRMGRAAGTWIFSAAGRTESAYETGGLGHGLFTWALLAGLDGQADHAGADRIITLSELESFVVTEVTGQARRLGIRQKPTIQRGQDDFPFYRLP